MIAITNKRARQLYLQEMIRMMIRLENIQARALKPVLNRQFLNVAKLSRQGILLDGVDYAVDRERKRLLNLFVKHYRRVATVFSKKAYKVVADSKKFMIVPEIKSPKDEFWSELNFWMRTETARKVTGIQKTSKKILANVIQKGMNDGLTNNDIAKNLVKKGRILTPFRAKTIAITETHTAAVKSVDSAIKSTRIEMEKEWVANIDKRTRLAHLEMESHPRVAQDANFIVGGVPMAYPGDPQGGANNTVRCLTSYKTPIYTSKGWKWVKNIKVGDLVLTHKNRFKKVLRLNNNLYDGDVVTIELTGQGKYITVTPEHPFLMIDGVWKKAKDICKNDKISFMAAYCQYCGKEIPYYLKYCDQSCGSKVTTKKQWEDPKHRENMSKKTSAQLKREFEVGRRKIDFYIKKEKLFVEVDGKYFHSDKEKERKRDLEILTQHPDHRIAHVTYGNPGINWEFFDLLSLNHTGTFAQTSMKVRSVITRQLKENIKTYNFAVEDDESYIAKGFITHNCRCVLMYHPVNRMDTLKPYVPETGVLGPIIPGTPVKSADDVLKHYEKSKNATFIKGKSANELKADIADRLGERMYSLKNKDMDDFIRPLSNRIATQDMGLDDYKVAIGNLIRQWAMTSGDTNSRSIMMQLAAEKEFGLKVSSIWWEDKALEEARWLFKTHEKATRRFLREMYKDTQKYLAKQGLKSVRATRGYVGDIGIKPSTIKNPIAKTKIQLQPMSSFSSDSGTATMFAGDELKRAIFFAEVPANRILSCPVTGYGCMDEFEYVILGSQKVKGEVVFTSCLKGKEISWLDLFKVDVRTPEFFDKNIANQIFKRTK